jgi:hypothetical protein
LSAAQRAVDLLLVQPQEADLVAALVVSCRHQMFFCNQDL